MKLVYNTFREAYGLEDVRRTMTVGELVAHLQEYDPDTPVCLSFDDGYTYGGITESRFEENFDDESDEEDC